MLPPAYFIQCPPIALETTAASLDHSSVPQRVVLSTLGNSGLNPILLAYCLRRVRMGALDS